jgi:hypothetical protein
MVKRFVEVTATVGVGVMNVYDYENYDDQAFSQQDERVRKEAFSQDKLLMLRISNMKYKNSEVC